MISKAKPLPMDIIREALEIDPTSKTGLRWKSRPRHHFATDRDWRIWNTRYTGKDAGSKIWFRSQLYFQVKIENRSYLSHRIVYFLAHGIDPSGMHIDHIDGNGTNNSPSNLRLATQQENQRNRGKQQNNTSGKKGVCWEKKRNKWRVQIGIHGSHKHLGYFDFLEDASDAYERAARELFGEFHKEGRTDALAQH